MSPAAETAFVAGALVFVLAGVAHAVLALVDTVRPTFFVPLESSAKTATQRTGVRLVRLLGGSGVRPSIWSVWLGIHIGFGVGLAGFGVVCLLIAAYDTDLIEGIGALLPLAIGVSLAYLLVAVRFFFRGSVALTAMATISFTAAAVLSA